MLRSTVGKWCECECYRHIDAIPAVPRICWLLNRTQEENAEPPEDEEQTTEPPETPDVSEDPSGEDPSVAGFLTASPVRRNGALPPSPTSPSTVRGARVKTL